MFYKDQPYIGVRKPYGYPDDAHFKNKYVVEDISSANFYEHGIAPSDFSEIKNPVFDPRTEFGMGSMDYINENKKMILLVAIALGIGYYAMKKRKA